MNLVKRKFYRKLFYMLLLSLVLTGISFCSKNESPALKALFQIPANTTGLSSINLSSGILTPSFTSTTTTYMVSVTNSVTSLTITPTAYDSVSSITVNGTIVTSGSVSDNIPLSVGTNTITIVVNGSNTYTLTVTRLSINTYRIFVTNRTTNANFPGIASADTFCNADTNKPDNVTFKALIVDDSGSRRACTSNDCTNMLENVDWVLKANSNYVRGSDLVPIFSTNSAGIFPYGAMTNSFKSGTQVETWTGLRTQWVSSGTNCMDWSIAAPGQDGRYGISDSTSNTAIRMGSRSCDQLLAIICAEQ